MTCIYIAEFQTMGFEEPKNSCLLKVDESVQSEISCAAKEDKSVQVFMTHKPTHFVFFFSSKFLSNNNYSRDCLTRNSTSFI